MTWRNDVKINKARIDNLFLGTAKGGLGTPMGASAYELMANDADFIYENFQSIPFANIKGGGAATGATGDENLLITPLSVFEQHILGAGQTIIVPVMAALGWDVGGDQTENEGAEYNWGGLVAGGKGVFTIGTDAAFFASLKFSIANVSGTDDCAFGFRTVEAYQANIDDYNNMAVLNVISGDIKIETIDDNGATSTTDTGDNWTDGETHTLKVLVSAAGVVTYEIDGVAPTTTAAHTIDDGDAVEPFFYFLHAAAPVAGAIVLQEFKCGLQTLDPDIADMRDI